MVNTTNLKDTPRRVLITSRKKYTKPVNLSELDIVTVNIPVYKKGEIKRPVQHTESAFQTTHVKVTTTKKHVPLPPNKVISKIPKPKAQCIKATQKSGTIGCSLGKSRRKTYLISDGGGKRKIVKVITKRCGGQRITPAKARVKTLNIGTMRKKQKPRKQVPVNLKQQPVQPTQPRRLLSAPRRSLPIATAPLLSKNTTRLLESHKKLISSPKLINRIQEDVTPEYTLTVLPEFLELIETLLEKINNLQNYPNKEGVIRLINEFKNNNILCELLVLITLAINKDELLFYIAEKIYALKDYSSLMTKIIRLQMLYKDLIKSEEKEN